MTDVLALLETLVAIDSTNTSIDPAGAGEAAMGKFLADRLGALGLAVTVEEVAPGRSNVVGVAEAAAGGPGLLLTVHLDTVPAPPGGIPIRREGGRLWGRGACDPKASLAAMLVAVEEVLNAGPPPVTIVVAGTVDEEGGMIGATRLASSLPPVRGAIIGEPTSLQPVRAHPGDVRFVVEASGVSSHSARPKLGHNAVLDAAAFVSAAEQLGLEVAKHGHPLTGPAVLTPTKIDGGRAPNMVPDQCRIVVDRRVPPGETTADALAQIDATVARLNEEGRRLTRHPPFVDLASVELPEDHPLVRLTEEVTGHPAVGIPFATDASRLAPAGIPCVVLGPGSIDQAHSADEWVDLGQAQSAVDIYRRILLAAARLNP